MRCENGDYFADVEAARGIAPPAKLPEALAATEDVATPGVTTIEALADLLGVDATATSKAMPVVVGDRLVLALVRGDDRLNEESSRPCSRRRTVRRRKTRFARPSGPVAARSAPSVSTSR